MRSSWKISLTDLLGLLRQSLASLVPIVERAKIPWRDGDAYDDWDAMAGCLYENLVVRSILHSEEVGSGIVLPKYDMSYPSYKDAYIQIEGGGVPEGVLAVFVGFAGTSPDFAAVKWIKMLPSGDVVEDQMEYSLYDECRFYLVFGKGVERKKVERLTIAV